MLSSRLLSTLKTQRSDAIASTVSRDSGGCPTT